MRIFKQLKRRSLMKSLTSWRAAQDSISLSIHLTYILSILIMFSSMKDTLKIWKMCMQLIMLLWIHFSSKISISYTKGTCFTYCMILLCLFSMLYLNYPVKNKVRNDILVLLVYLPVMNISEKKIIYTHTKTYASML